MLLIGRRSAIGRTCAAHAASVGKAAPGRQSREVTRGRGCGCCRSLRRRGGGLGRRRRLGRRGRRLGGRASWCACVVVVGLAVVVVACVVVVAWPSWSSACVVVVGRLRRRRRCGRRRRGLGRRRRGLGRRGRRRLRRCRGRRTRNRHRDACRIVIPMREAVPTRAEHPDLDNMHGRRLVRRHGPRCGELTRDVGRERLPIPESLKRLRGPVIDLEVNQRVGARARHHTDRDGDRATASYLRATHASRGRPSVGGRHARSVIGGHDDDDAQGEHNADRRADS